MHEAALWQGPPSFSVLYCLCPHRSQLSHHAVYLTTLLSSNWSYALCLPLCASNGPSTVWAEHIVQMNDNRRTICHFKQPKYCVLLSHDQEMFSSNMIPTVCLLCCCMHNKSCWCFCRHLVTSYKNSKTQSTSVLKIIVIFFISISPIVQVFDDSWMCVT